MNMKLNANEVRIGNYVTIGDGPFQISANDIKKMSESDNHIYKPIPLNDAWLTDFKLTKKELDAYDNMWCLDLFTIFSDNYNEEHYYTYGLLTRLNNPNVCNSHSGLIVKYVHQLQNLFFATNYEELQRTNEYGV